MKRRVATVWVADGMICCRLTFCQALLQELKQDIPQEFRQWRPKPEGYWQISPQYADTLDALLKRYGYSVTYLQSDAGLHGKEAAFARLWKYMDSELLIKLRRLLLRKHHPDVGGSEDATKEILEAFEELEQ